MKEGKKEKSRIFGLDILRALAVLCVLFAHTNGLLLPQSIYLSVAYYFGFIGVEIFFVLSGFLIGTILIKIHEKQKTTGYKQIISFWVRRWFRTLPNYYLVLVLYLVIYSFVKPELMAAARGDIWKYFLFIQNVTDWDLAFFGVSWSLTVEEWFYLSFPIGLLVVQLFTRGQKKRAIFFTTFSYLVIGLVLRLAFHNSFDGGWPVFTKVMPLRLDSIGMGVLVAALNFYYPTSLKKHAGKLAVAGIIALVGCSYILYQDFLMDKTGSFFLGTWFLTLLSLSIAMAVPYFNELRTSKNGLAVRSITHISLISYSIYLIHMLFMAVANNLPVVKEYDIAVFVVVWVGTIGIATVQYYYFEKPMTELRTRFTYKGEDVSMLSKDTRGKTQPSKDGQTVSEPVSLS